MGAMVKCGDAKKVSRVSKTSINVRVRVQHKCHLSNFATVTDYVALDITRGRFIGGLLVLRYFRTVFPVDARLPGYCPDGQAPAFRCMLTASHLAICFGVGFLGTEVAFLRILAAPLSWSRSFSSALSLSSEARTLSQRLPRPLRSGSAWEECPLTPAQDVRTGWSLLAGDELTLVLNDQLTVQSLKHIHLHSSVGRTFHPGQQLKRTPSVSHSVVLCHFATVPEAQHPIQTRPSVHSAVGDFRLRSRYPEALVEVRKEVSQNDTGIFDGGRTRESEARLQVCPGRSLPLVPHGPWPVETARRSSVFRARPSHGRTGLEHSVVHSPVHA